MSAPTPGLSSSSATSRTPVAPGLAAPSPLRSSHARPRPPSKPRPVAAIPEFSVGERIAEMYVIKQVLAKGSALTAYLAQHERWDTEIVLKAPAADLLADATAMQQLHEAADEWMALGMHRHVTAFHYVHPLDDAPLLVIEKADGGNLRARLSQLNDDDIRTSLDLALQLCHALEHAHSRGILHRAVKPENVLLAGDGTLKLSDFALAARLAQRAMLAAGAAASPYVAPEQWIAGAEVDARSDVFAFGVCLYEMLCGRTPYEVARGSRCEPPVPTMRSGGSLHQRLSKLVTRCVDWDREQRPWSMTEVRQELAATYAELFGQPSPLAEPPQGSPEADGWNNRALSYFMLDRAEEGEAALDTALSHDSWHLLAIYNRGLTLWRRGLTTDQRLVERLKEARPRPHELWEAKYLLAQVHLDRGETALAIDLLRKAMAMAPDEAEPRDLLRRAEAGDFPEARCLSLIEGHTNYVTCAAVAADGRLAVSGGHDNTLRVWDIPTGRCLRVLEGHHQHVLSVAVSSDGRVAVSGSDEEPLRLWEVTTGRCLRTFDVPSGRVYGVALSGDGKIAVSTGVHTPRGIDVGGLQVWATESGRPIGALRGHVNYVKAVSMTPDGRWVLSGSDDRTARLWDLSTGRCVRVLQEHDHHVSAVYICPDGQWAVTGSWDETLRLWNLATGRCTRTFTGHPSLVTAVHVLPEVRRVLSGSWDRTVRLWDMDSGRCLRTFEGHGGVVTSVHLLAKGQRAFSSSWDMTLRLWQTPEVRSEACTLRAIRPQAGTLSEASVTRRVQQTLAVVDDAIGRQRYRAALDSLRELRALDADQFGSSVRAAARQLSLVCRRTALREAKAVEQLGEIGNTTAAWLSSDGSWAVAGERDGGIRIWDAASGKCRVLEGHADRVSSLSVSADERRLLSAGFDRALRLWEIATGDCLQVYEGHLGVVTAAGLSADGNCAVSGSYDHTIRVWDVATGRCVRALKGHTRQVSSVALSFDGRRVLSGSHDRTVRLWDVASGSCAHVFQGHTRQVGSVELSGDGGSALSSGNDGSIRLWELATGQLLQLHEAHSDGVVSARMSADGHWIFSLGRDRTLRVWDVSARRCHAIVEGLPERVSVLSLSHDGCRLLTAGADQKLLLWELDWELEARDPEDWDEGARPYLEAFVAAHLQPGADESPIVDQDAIVRLLTHLQHAGFGWLRPDGVRGELQELIARRETSPLLKTASSGRSPSARRRRATS